MTNVIHPPHFDIYRSKAEGEAERYQPCPQLQSVCVWGGGGGGGGGGEGERAS